MEDGRPRRRRPPLWERLREVDPERASRLHPRDERKIARSLQVYERTGRRHSDLLREQRAAQGGSRLGGPIRFNKCLVLWVKCDQVTVGGVFFGGVGGWEG